MPKDGFFVPFIAIVRERGKYGMNAFFETRDDALTCVVSEGLTFPMHLHPQLELFFVLSGETSVTVRRETRTLGPGSLAVIFPNQIHSYTACSKETRAALVVCDLALTGGFSDTLLLWHPANPFLPPEALHPNVAFAVGELTAERRGGGDRAVCSALVQLALARVLPQLSLHRNRASDYSELTYQIAQYVSAHFREPLTLDVLARALGVSRFHLSHVFSEKIGQSFSSYLASIRVDCACALLAGTNRSVTEIAAESGFESQRSFFRAFGARCGMTPLAYRRRAQGTQAKT